MRSARKAHLRLHLAPTSNAGRLCEAGQIRQGLGRRSKLCYRAVPLDRKLFDRRLKIRHGAQVAWGFGICQALRMADLPFRVQQLLPLNLYLMLVSGGLVPLEED